MMQAGEPKAAGQSRLARRKTIRALATGALALMLVAGCSLKLPGSGSPPRVFVLSPKSTFDDNLPVVDWQLLIDSPIAAAGLDTSRIALRHSLIELQYFADAAWTDASPKMVQRLLIESFENSGKIVSVGRQAVGLRADYILTTELREFQAEYEGKPEGAAPDVHSRINVKLVKMPQRIIVASQTYDYMIPAESPDMISIVHAFDDALGKSLKRIVSWAITEGEKHRNQ